jgi:hypothetical protein
MLRCDDQEVGMHRISAGACHCKKAGPLLISTSRPGGKANHINPSRVFYSDVALQLVGTDASVNAQ